MLDMNINCANGNGDEFSFIVFDVLILLLLRTLKMINGTNREIHRYFNINERKWGDSHKMEGRNRAIPFPSLILLK